MFTIETEILVIGGGVTDAGVMRDLPMCGINSSENRSTELNPGCTII